MKLFDIKEYKFAKVFKKDLAEIQDDFKKVEAILYKWRKYKEVRKLLNHLEMSNHVIKMHQEHYELVLKDKGRVK
jgi:hypothetical protein